MEAAGIEPAEDSIRSRGDRSPSGPLPQQTLDTRDRRRRIASVPAITVDPVSSLIDHKPTTLTVSGLQAGQKVRLRLESKDAHDVTWVCSDPFQADGEGTVDVLSTVDRPHYDPMHLFNGLRPDKEPADGRDLVYSWSPNPHSWSDPTPRDFTLTVRDVADKNGDGKAWASVTLQRQAGPAAEDVTVAPGGSVRHARDPREEHHYSYGVYGRFFRPPPTDTLAAAVLIFGGSEGNIGAPGQVAAGLLAARGYPALALGYFATADPPWQTFPTQLVRIPLEYFKGALDWLVNETSPSKLFVSGTSRGSEAALLLAANHGHILGDPPSGPYAGLGVIANVPSSLVMCAIDAGGPDPKRSGWTLNGKDIPFSVPAKANPAAAIPVEQISGPIFLDGGDFDAEWGPQHAIDSMLQLKQRASGNPNLEPHEFRRGGHGLGVLVAYLPRWFSTSASIIKSLADSLRGRYPDDNRIADGVLWPKLLDFLHKHS